MIPPGSVVMGSPGRIIRQAESRDLAWITRGNEAYRIKAREYARKLSQNTALPSSITTA
jgi:carbonic anhydrase/acetyltransferase-like protein (isoleucine patch superfamily)